MEPKTVTLSVGAVHTMLAALHAFNNGTMTPHLGAGVAAAMSLAYSQLEAAVMPRGIRLGYDLPEKDNSRTPIFSLEFSSQAWRDDRISVAYDLMAAAKRAADHFDTPNGYNAFFATRDHYFSDLLSIMNLAGFDTYADGDGFAVYAPEGTPRAVLTPKFRKAVMHAPRP